MPDAGIIDPETWSSASCNLTCPCYNAKTKGLQPVNQQVGFKVIKGGFWNTLGYVVSSAGAQISSIVETGVNLVDAVGKGLAGFFSKWWVILMIVIVGLVIILVPTLVTQLPKAKAKVSGGGRHYLSDAHSYLYT
jgi:hypothetical protein